MQLLLVFRRILSICTPAWHALIGSMMISVLLLLAFFAILVHIGPNPYANLPLFHLAYELAQLPFLSLLLGIITSACLEEQFSGK